MYRADRETTNIAAPYHPLGRKQGMNYLRKLMIALAVVASGSATTAYAQATRTWVSGVGDDANPCSRTAPCKTFAGAISKTAAGGEINCLDPAGFGAVTITKSIIIDCTATLGGLLASSTTGVIVNGAAVAVVLRGLQINGGTPSAPGVNGIRFLQGGSLTVENSLIQNFNTAANPNGNGILFNGGTFARIHLTNTSIINNGASANGSGIAIRPTGVGSANVTLEDVRLIGNAEAALLIDTTGLTGSSTNVVATRTLFASSRNGISVTGPAGTPGASVTITNSMVSGNVINGLLATGPVARINASSSTIVGNSTGVLSSGGGLLGTFGDNVVIGNGAAGTFSGTLTKS
jgi:hypothetical protein